MHQINKLEPENPAIVMELIRSSIVGMIYSMGLDFVGDELSSTLQSYPTPDPTISYDDYLEYRSALDSGVSIGDAQKKLYEKSSVFGINATVGADMVAVAKYTKRFTAEQAEQVAAKYNAAGYNVKASDLQGMDYIDMPRSAYNSLRDSIKSDLKITGYGTKSISYRRAQYVRLDWLKSGEIGLNLETTGALTTATPVQYTSGQNILYHYFVSGAPAQTSADSEYILGYPMRDEGIYNYYYGVKTGDSRDRLIYTYRTNNGLIGERTVYRATSSLIYVVASRLTKAGQWDAWSATPDGWKNVMNQLYIGISSHPNYKDENNGYQAKFYDWKTKSYRDKQALDYPIGVLITGHRITDQERLKMWMDTQVKVTDTATAVDGATTQDRVTILPMPSRVSWDEVTGTGTVVEVPPVSVVLDNTGIISKPIDVPDVDVPDIDVPELDALKIPSLITTKFPFCIPFDIYRGAKILVAQPEVPLFRIPIRFKNNLFDIDEELVVDLAPFEEVAKISRWFAVLIFTAALAFATRKLIGDG